MSTATSANDSIPKRTLVVHTKVTPPPKTPPPPSPLPAVSPDDFDDLLRTYPEITSGPNGNVLALVSLKSLGCSISTVSCSEFDARGFLKFIIERYPKIEVQLVDMEFEFYMDKELEKMSTWEMRSLLAQYETTRNPPIEQNLEIIRNGTRVGLTMILKHCMRKYDSSVFGAAYSSCPATNQTFESFVVRQHQLRSTFPARQLTVLREAISKKTSNPPSAPAENAPKSPPVPTAGLPKRDASPKRK